MNKGVDTTRIGTNHHGCQRSPQGMLGMSQKRIQSIQRNTFLNFQFHAITFRCMMVMIIIWIVATTLFLFLLLLLFHHDVMFWLALLLCMCLVCRIVNHYGILFLMVVMIVVVVVGFCGDFCCRCVGRCGDLLISLCGVNGHQGQSNCNIDSS